MTVEQRLQSLRDVQGVLAAYLVGQVTSEPGVDYVPVAWVTGGVDVGRKDGGTLIATGRNTEAEAAIWGGSLPAPQVPAAVAPGYITERNPPFTAAQVKAFINATWRGTTEGGASAPDVLAIEMDNLDGKSIRVSGLFWIAENGTRSDRAYVIRFVDANGATSGANVKFERIL
jgi:hypothetical protein